VLKQTITWGIIIGCVFGVQGLDAKLNVHSHAYNSYIKMAQDDENTNGATPIPIPTQAPLLPLINTFGSPGTNQVLFSQMSLTAPELHLTATGNTTSSDEEVRIIGPLLNYPNPFKMRDGTIIGYELSREAEIDFYVYDIYGHQIYHRRIASTEDGGLQGYHPFNFSSDDINGIYIPAAAYFYFVVHEGRVLGKGKMVVIP